jgi:hypothetical protein
VKRKTGFVITDRHVTIKYLLGTLPEAERLRIEQAFFSADEAFEAMLAAEDELFGEYALDTLAPDQRAAFEARFLATPEGRRKLAFATALMEALGRHDSVRAKRPLGAFARVLVDRAWLQVAAVAAVIVLAVATAWLARDLGRARSAAESARAQQEGQRLRLEGELAEARRAPAAPLVASVVLSSGLTRGSGDVVRIVLAPNVDVLRVQLEAARVAPGSFRATLRTAEGDVIWSGPASRAPAGDLMAIDLPAPLLSTHDYEITLSVPSGALIASYPVTVVRR